MSSPDYHVANVERFSGLSDRYHAARPRPPELVVEVLTRLAAVERPSLVVDLGCGTGLSIWIWAERAAEVVGVEPNAEMRRQAELELARLRSSRPDRATVRLLDALSTATGLPRASADIVTCSQSFHWMEPEPTLAEVARILRPGGVFATYHPEYPPTVHWELEAAYRAFMARVRSLERERGASPGVVKWDKDRQLEWLETSGRFRFVKEIALHSVETGDAERFAALTRSQSPVNAVLRAGCTEAEIGLDALDELARRLLGQNPAPWYFSWLVRVGVK
ncbi:MAG: methyltransferase domain-containing protein [Gemmatimonadetes bacterium]|nr:methyltransferase domain-containing protein [Gemmatimonadota bacterium]